MWSGTRRALFVIIAFGVLAAALTLVYWPGGAEQAPPPVAAPLRVAAIDALLKVDRTVVQALDNLPFAFSSGEVLTPALKDQPVTLTFTDTAAVRPSFTLTAPNVGGTDGNPALATGTIKFGSCTFIVTFSTFAPGTGPQVGDTVTVNPCQVNLQTGGVSGISQTTIVQILLQLGAVVSAANIATVSINPANGVVTVNNVMLPEAVGSLILNALVLLTVGPPLTVTAVTPNSGTTLGGTTVTITGTRFSSGAGVKFGGMSATITGVTSTTITAITPAMAAGTVDVVVTNPDASSGSLANGFLFLVDGTIPSVSEWGLIALAVLLAGGLIVMRRRSQRA